MRALIVDDDKTTCQLLAKILKSTGLDAEWTTDSLAGYNLSLEQHYDLFILDVRMPLLLGTEFAEGLKKENPRARSFSFPPLPMRRCRRPPPTLASCSFRNLLH